MYSTGPAFGVLAHFNAAPMWVGRSGLFEATETPYSRFLQTLPEV